MPTTAVDVIAGHAATRRSLKPRRRRTKRRRRPRRTQPARRNRQAEAREASHHRAQAEVPEPRRAALDDRPRRRPLPHLRLESQRHPDHERSLTMGLDFRHNRPPGHHCPQWSYTGFNDFRERLAASEGFPLSDMQGFGHGDYFDGSRIHGERNWDEITTPLKSLLNHSDCEGNLTAEECGQVAPRLREVVNGWPDTYELHYDRQNALRLADCMDVCAATGQKLEFC